MVHLLRVASQSYSFCNFKTPEGTQRKPLPGCPRRCAGRYLICIVSIASKLYLLCTSFRTDLEWKGCSKEPRKQREAGDAQAPHSMHTHARVVSSTLLSVVSLGASLLATRAFSVVGALHTLSAAKTQGGCGQQTTSCVCVGGGCLGAVLQHATVSGWKDLLPPRHITQDVFVPYLLFLR